MDGLRTVVIIFWFALCITASVFGFMGNLIPFYAGLGWLVAGLLSMIFLYAYYKITKLLENDLKKGYASILEELKKELQKQKENKNDL